MNLRVHVIRGSTVESRHTIHAATANSDLKVRDCCGDPNYFTYMRSAAKPLITAFIAYTGTVKAYNLSPQEIAIISASHGGQEKHMNTVRSILHKAGLDEHHLCCGELPPIQPQARKAWRSRGGSAVLSNNCSGKHSGMLAACRHLDHPVEEYLHPDHPLQQQLKAFFTRLLDIESRDLKTGVDGCGFPVYALRLADMARLYSFLASPQDRALAPQVSRALQTVQHSMQRHPDMIAGDGLFTTELMQNVDRLVAKGGAEGVFCLGRTDTGQALALKVEDGNSRAVSPAVVEILHQLGWITSGERDRLRQHHQPELKNARQETIGTITPDVETETDWRSD